jgi:effector-binding domain-containing protein
VGPPFLRVLDMGPPFLMEVGFPVAVPVEAEGRVVASSLPGAQVARAVHMGSHDELPTVYEVLSGWITEQGMEVSGPPWESYLDGPEVPEPRTVVSWPCR